MSQLVNAEVNSGNSSTSNYTLQLRIRECHAGMKCDLKVTKHYSHCLDPENIHTPPLPSPPPPSHAWFFTLDPPPHPTPWNWNTPPPPAKFLFHLNRRPLQIYHENTAMSKLHIESTMLDLNLSSRI